MPLDVFGTVRGGASTISSGGVPAMSVVTLVRACLQCCTRRRIGFAGLGQNNDALGAGRSIGHAKDRDAALADSGDAGHRLLDLLRIEMTARANDDVLDAAGDVDVAAGHVGAVAAVEPTVVNEFAGLGLVVEIAARRRRAAKFEPSFLPFAELVAGLVDDANFVTGQRLAAGHDLERLRVARLCRLSHADAALSLSRSTRSMTGGRPSGGKASPTELSARP